jgi:hypothetical protein
LDGELHANIRAPGWQDTFSVPYDAPWWIAGQKSLNPSPA